MYTYEVVKLGHVALRVGDDVVDLLAGLHDAPERPEGRASRAPKPHLAVEALDLVLLDARRVVDDFLAVAEIHRQVRAVPRLALGVGRVREVRLERPRKRLVVVVCAPLMEVVGNIVPAVVGRRVLKVDDNVLVVLGNAGRELGIE